MANYNPFDEREIEKKRDQNWFQKVAIKGAFFVGTAAATYGFYKAGGPARKLLERYADIRLNNVFVKESAKAGDNFDAQLNSSAMTLRNEILEGVQEAWMGTDAEVKDAWKMTNPEAYTIGNIREMEQQVLVRGEVDVNVTLSKKFEFRQPGAKFAPTEYVALHGYTGEGQVGVSRQVKLTGTESEQFARLRQATILEYLQRYGPNTEADIGTIQQDEMIDAGQYFSGEEYLTGSSVQDEKYGRKIINRVDAIHEEYLKDRKYAQLYQRRLKSLHRRYMMNSYSYTFGKNKIPKKTMVQVTEANFKRYLYGNLTETPFNMAEANIAKADRIVSLFDSTKESNFRFRKISSSSRNRIDRGINLIDRPSSFDYSGQLRTIVKKLQSAAENPDDTGIRDFKIKMETYGSGAEEKRYINIMIQHANERWKDPIEINIPMAVDGRLPGSSPSSTARLDRNYIVGNLYGSRADMERYYNSTQMILREVSSALDGSMISGIGSFRDDPEHFRKRLRNIIVKQVSNLPLAQGNISDLIQINSFADPTMQKLVLPQRSGSQTMRRRLGNFINTVDNMKRVHSVSKRGRVAVISFDLESLSNKRSGLQWQTDPATQFVKAGISVHDYNDGNKLIQFDEVSSSHGFSYFDRMDRRKEGSGFNEALNDLINNLVLPDGVNSGEGAKQAYQKFIKQEVAAGRMRDDIASNRDFFDIVGKKLTNLIEHLKSKAGGNYDDVVVVTKNGWEFDIKALQRWNNEAFQKIRSSVIDVQNTRYARKEGMFQDISLKIEKTITTMLGRAGITENEISRRGANMSSPQGVRKMLKLVGEAQKKLGGDMYKFLTIDNGMLQDLQKKGLLTRGHVSPVLDALFTSALFREDMADMMQSDALYDTVEPLRKILNIKPQDRSPEDLMAIARFLDQKTIPGFGVLSAGAISQGMAAQLRYSLVHPEDLYGLSGNPLNRQLNQIVASKVKISPAKTWLSGFGNDNLARRRELMKKFKPLITTNVTDAAMDQFRIPQATDAANYFSHTLNMKTLLTWDAVGGEEGFLHMKDQALGTANFTREMSVPLNDITNSDPVLNQKIMDFYKKQEREAIKIAGGVGNVRHEHRVAAAKLISENEDHMIQFDSEVMSANKYGGEISVSGRKIGGKISYVALEANKNNPRNSLPQMMAKLEITIPGRELMDVASVQITSPMGKMVGQRVKTLSDGIAYGIPEGFEAVGHAQFLSKGFVGSSKNVFMHSIISDIYEVLNDPKADAKLKSRYRGLLDEISKTLNAEVNPEEYLFRVNRTSGIDKPKGQIDAFIEMVGDQDLTISKIMEWKRRMGSKHQWTPERIKSFKDKGLNVEQLMAHYKKSLDETINTIDKGIRSGDAAYKHLTKEQADFYRSELNATRQMFNINPESPAMFLPVQISKDQWTIGLQSVAPLTIYGMDGREARPFDAKFRQDYMVALKNSPHLSRSSADFITRHTYADRYVEYQSAKQTYMRFLDRLVGKKMTEGKPLSLEQIDFLVKRKEQLNIAGQIDNMAKGKDWVSHTRGALARAKLEMESLMETQEVLTNPLLRDKLEQDLSDVTDLIDKKDAGDLLGAMKRSDRFFHSTEVDQFSRLAKENDGILTFNLSGPGNEPYTMDIDQMLRDFSDDVAGAKGADIMGLGQKLKNKLAAIQNQARKHSSKNPKDQVLTPLIEFEDGKLKMKTIDIAWDPFPMNEFNYLVGDLALATPEARIKMDLMIAVKNYQDTLTDGVSSDIEIAKMKLDQEWLRYFTVGLSSNVGSKFWTAGQYQPRGVWGTHYGMDRIQANAIYAKADGRLKREFSGKYNVDSILDNLTKSSLNTVAMTENMFNKFSVVLPTGETVKYARHIDEKLGKMGQTISKEVRRGYRPMPGGIMYRYPIPQAGQDGLMDVNFMVIPDEVGAHLGMDGNTFYAHTILSGLQGWDNDGDQGVFHLKELDTISTMKQYAKEGRQSLERILQHHKIKDIIKRTEMAFDEQGNLVKKLKVGPLARIVGIGNDGDTAMVSVLNSEGVVETRMAAMDMLDFSDQTKQITDIATGLAAQTRRGVTADAASKALSEAYFPYASKNLIPFATNIIKKRAMQLAASANNVKNPRALYDFIGDYNHALAGISQLSINFGKHGDPQKAARLSNTMVYLRNPLGNQKFKEDALQTYKEQFQNYIEAPSDEYLEESFKLATGEIENIERFARMNQEFRTYNNSVTDFMMGKSNASVLDVLSASLDEEFTMPTMPRGKQASVFKELAEAVSTRFDLPHDVATYRKFGKGAAIGAAVYLGLSLFRPFGDSKSLNPVDMFIDLGYNADGNPNAISSDLELPRHVPIDMVNASFSKQAFIKLNRAGEGEDRAKSAIINNLLRSSILTRPDDVYEFRSRPNIQYSNYTMDINSLGNSNLDRKSRML